MSRNRINQGNKINGQINVYESHDLRREPLVKELDIHKSTPNKHPVKMISGSSRPGSKNNNALLPPIDHKHLNIKPQCELGRDQAPLTSR